MTFGMSFDSLLTIVREINGSKKSQSLGSDIKRHITLNAFLLPSGFLILVTRCCISLGTSILRRLKKIYIYALVTCIKGLHFQKEQTMALFLSSSKMQIFQTSPLFVHTYVRISVLLSVPNVM